MIQALLSRHKHECRPTLPVLGEAEFTLARVHEICGTARRTLALQIAARAGAPVFWLAPSWGTDPLNPDGIREFLPPQDVMFLSARRSEDLLWSMEEILRSGAVPLVVADLPAPPALTPVRRLHLAAETGATEGQYQPLGLILTPGAGGAQGVESRWLMDPCHHSEGRRWRLERLRARTAPVRNWVVTDGTGNNGLQLLKATLPLYKTPSPPSQ
jgi:protein ImuA